jgi:hypothetical protein
VYYTTAGAAGPYSVIRARKDDPTVQEIIANLPTAAGTITVLDVAGGGSDRAQPQRPR